MKTIFTLLLGIFMISANAETPPTNLQLDGKFLSQNNVRYNVYIINADSSLDAQVSGRGFRYFAVQMELGEHYLIRFQSPKGSIKLLYVEVTKPGTFTIDVDFDKEGSAQVYYNTRTESYDVSPIPKALLEYARQ